MNTLNSGLAFFLFLLTLQACGSSSSDSEPEQEQVAPTMTAQWQLPNCDTVSGVPAVTFSLDGGESLTARDEQQELNHYPLDLITLDSANVLLATYLADGFKLIRSTDAGCNWEVINSTERTFIYLAKAPGDVVYGWHPGKDYLYKFENNGEQVVELVLPGSISGIDISSENPNLILVMVHNQVYESTNGGETWTTKGLEANSPFPRDVSFSALDKNHIIISDIYDGAWVTFDGGNNWTKSSGFGTEDISGFNVTISPLNDSIVWLSGRNNDEEGSSHPSNGRHVYLSRDGGLSFTSVIDKSSELIIVNSTRFFPHPSDENVVYFAYSINTELGLRSRLINYNDQSQALNIIDYDYSETGRAYSLAFSPIDPDVIYLGLAKKYAD